MENQEFKNIQEFDLRPLLLSKEGTPLVLNKEKKLVESLQFKQLMKVIKDRKIALRVYNAIKKIELGEFKNSKLRDENGELMIVWHGSPRKFKRFDLNAKGEFSWRNTGLHFQSSREIVFQYALKAQRAWSRLLLDIAAQRFGFEDGYFYKLTFKDLPREQKEEAIKIYNEIIEDLIKNGEDSKFFHKGYVTRYNPESGKLEERRDPSLDYILYGKRTFGMEWVLEIFGYQMPTKENCSLINIILDDDDVHRAYFGNEIGGYIYAAVLNIENPFYEDTRHIDFSFKEGEKSHKEKGTDGMILTHSQNIIGDGNIEVSNTKGTYSVAVFDPDRIKIIGVENIGVEKEGKFEINKEFMK